MSACSKACLRGGIAEKRRPGGLWPVQKTYRFHILHTGRSRKTMCTLDPAEIIKFDHRSQAVRKFGGVFQKSESLKRPLRLILSAFCGQFLWDICSFFCQVSCKEYPEDLLPSLCQVFAPFFLHTLRYQDSQFEISCGCCTRS